MSVDLDDELSLENTKADPSEETTFVSDRVKTEMERCFLEVEKPEYITFLTDLSCMLPFEMHEYTSAGSQICRKSKLLGEENCKYCLEDDKWSKTTPKAKNKAKPAIAIPVYNFSAVGRKKTLKDKDGNPKKDKEGNAVVYESKPIQGLVLKRGNDDGNLVSLKEYHEMGMMLDGVWELRRAKKEDKKTLVPTVTERKITENKFKKKLDVPADIKERWANMPVKEVRGYLANLFGVYNDSAPARLFDLTIKPQALEDDSTEQDVSKAMDG